jgi:hypothetical protein
MIPRFSEIIIVFSKLKLTPEAAAVLGKQVGIFFDAMEDPNRQAMQAMVVTFRMR